MRDTRLIEQARNLTRKLVWLKGYAIPGFDPAVWRCDTCDSVMKFSEYGNTDSEYGWEIDHIEPREIGGRTRFDNLRPLNWQNNRAKGDRYPWTCGS